MNSNGRVCSQPMKHAKRPPEMCVANTVSCLLNRTKL